MVFTGFDFHFFEIFWDGVGDDKIFMGFCRGRGRGDRKIVPSGGWKGSSQSKLISFSLGWGKGGTVFQHTPF